MSAEIINCVAFKDKGLYISTCLKSYRTFSSLNGLLDAQTQLNDYLERLAYVPGGLDDLRNSVQNPSRPLLETVGLSLRIFGLSIKSLFRPTEFATWNYNLPTSLEVFEKLQSQQNSQPILS